MPSDEPWSDPALSDPPATTFADVAGLETECTRLRESMVVPVTDDRYDSVGASGVLFHGPAGTGKTHVARALLGELAVPVVELEPAAMPLSDGDAAARYLGAAFDLARESQPCAVFLDDFETLAADGDESDWAADRPTQVVATLRSELDRIDDPAVDVLLVATTSRLAAIDPAVRRSGRIDLTLGIESPDEMRRQAVLEQELTRLTEGTDLTVEASLSLWTLAPQLHAFTVADLVELVQRAVRTVTAAEDADTVTMSHLVDAMESVADDRDYSTDPGDDGDDEDEDTGLGELFGSSDDEDEDDDTDDAAADSDGSGEDAAGEDGADSDEVYVGFQQTIEPPDVTYDDVGGLDEAKRRLRELVEWPRQYPERFAELDLDTSSGILLYGPPGTGKTLLAKATANETDSSFISVEGPEILDKYVGESERAIRNIFDLARDNAPSVVFIDELDAIAPNRGGYAGSNDYLMTVVNQLLSELDGFESLADVVTIGATNRPAAIDPALRRPGRFGEHLEVGFPDEAGRREIFRVQTAARTLADDVTPAWLAGRTDSRYTGADIAAVCEEAAMAAMRESVETPSDEVPAISRDHFETALAAVDPSGETHRRNQRQDATYQ